MDEPKKTVQFVNEFVRMWLPQLKIPPEDCSNDAWLLSEDGPHLSLLPDDFLPSLDKLLFSAKLQLEKDPVTLEYVEHVTRIMQALSITCRNLDNIPFVASCQFVSSSCCTILYLMKETTGSCEELRYHLGRAVDAHCLFLETLYDPYFHWRRKRADDLSTFTGHKALYQPAFLHPEVIPYIYDCVQLCPVEQDSELRTSFVSLLGAIISGAEYNALKAISPATVQILFQILAKSASCPSLTSTVLRCIVKIVHLILQFKQDQCQVELNYFVEMYQSTVSQIIAAGVSEDTREEDVYTLVTDCLSAMADFVRVQNSESLKLYLCRTGIVDFFIMVLFDSKISPEKKRCLATTVIDTVAAILQNSSNAKELLALAGYRKLFEALKSLGTPTTGIVDAVLSLITEKGDCVQNVDPLLSLLQWLPDFEDGEQQVSTASRIQSLCSASLQSKALCCQRGVIAEAARVLDCHDKLQQRTVQQLLRLIQCLGAHSITAAELKLILRLMRSEDDVKTFPYSPYVLHCISSMAKKDAAYQECHCYFDLQSGGISVPGFSQWQNPGYGLSFFAWLRLDNQDKLDSTANPMRRILYSLVSNKNQGFEAFFLWDGTLVVGVVVKKELITAMVHDVDFSDEQWHSLCVSHIPSRRPFGQSQLCVFVDGVQRCLVSVKLPPINDNFNGLEIGFSSGTSKNRAHLAAKETLTFPRRIGETAAKTLLPSLVNQMPNYLSLPLSLGSLKGLTGDQEQDPAIRSVAVESKDALWGAAGALGGQLGAFVVLHESMNLQQAKSLHDAGPNNAAFLLNEETPETTDISSKIALFLSARSFHNCVCQDLSINGLNGHTLAPVCTTWDVKAVLGCIGGVQALFPILESSAHVQDNIEHVANISPAIPVSEQTEADEWEILPSSSYADWKLEQNLVSGFLSLLRNVLHRHPYNMEQLLRGSNIAVIGHLMQKAHSSLMDVQALMAVQLLVEFARDFSDPVFQQQIQQHLLFDMRIWIRCPFHVRIGHIQYLSNLIWDDWRGYRKRYGIPFMLDVIKQHYCSNGSTELSPEDRRTVRQAIMGIVKTYLNKEITYTDTAAILAFLFTVREEELVAELLDAVIGYLEGKNCKDQFYLLVLEPNCAELMHSLLLERTFSVDLRTKILKLMVNIIRTDKVYEKSKHRLKLYDLGFGGLFCLLQGQPVNLEAMHYLMDIVLSKDQPNAYSGVLALASYVAEEGLELKLEFCKRLLAFILSKPQAPGAIVKETSWQESIVRLLVKRPIKASGHSGLKLMVNSAMEMEEDAASLKQASTPTSPQRTWRASSITGSLNVGLGLEQDLKDVAESVGNLVAGAVTGNFAMEELQTMAETVADNIHNVAGNLQNNLQSAVNNAYSLLRQKTIKVQGSLEELGENTLQRLKKRSFSQASGGEAVDCPDSTAAATPSPRLTKGARFLTGTLEVALEALSFDHGEDESNQRRDLSGLNAKSFDYGPADSLDAESYSLISEVSGQWSGFVLDSAVEPEEELCNTILSMCLVLLWRGIPGCSKDDWRERSHVFSCINLLGLNNELYKSHLELKRRLVEMVVQAAAGDWRKAETSGGGHINLNYSHVIRWVYDLIVLDPHEDETKKNSLKLLESTVHLLDTMNVFEEVNPLDKELVEVYHMALCILVKCCASLNTDLCAMAAARLHALVQLKQELALDEGAFILYNLSAVVKTSNQAGGSRELCAFLVPVIKAVLDKIGLFTDLAVHFPELSPSAERLNSSFFDEFVRLSQEPVWQTWLDDKIRSRCEEFRSVHLLLLPEVMNRDWAESDEAAMVAVHRKNREVNESKIRFQNQILDSFRFRQMDEQNRYNAMLSHQRGHALLIRKKWRQLKQFLTGPRGAWASRTSTQEYWKLSNHENTSRMRLKLVPNLQFDPHTQASKLRDNSGYTADSCSADPLNSLTSHALKPVLNSQEAEDSLTEEDIALAASLEKEEMATDGKEKIVVSENCELITHISVIKGRFEVTRSHLCFWDEEPASEERERFDLKWSVTQLQEMHLRRYNQRRSALEFFLTDHTNYFLNFTTKTRNRVYTRILSLRPPNLLYYTSRSPADVLRYSGLTQRWIQREISNFDYLMQLNTIAGRTYNDLAQYPVFPWIIADYTSKELDLNNPATFRDLSKPIGVVNPKNAKEVKAKYDHFEDPSGTVAKFHYGTHYSNAAGVLHYLVRMEPFTSLHIELQSGRFDVADRQFHSIPSTWRLLMDNPNDVKELIPEFFYLPEFLVNHNKFDLGVLQTTKQRVNDVELPAWASSAHDFIEKHRLALESEYVSSRLHEWIDLIFGFKQKGPAAVEALNVFYYCSYEGAVDLDAIADPVERHAVEGMINHFGQTPCQLFKEPHPKRLTPGELLHKSKLPPSLFSMLSQPLRTFYVDIVAEDRDFICFLNIPHGDPQQGHWYGYQNSVTADTLVSVGRNAVVGLNTWLPTDKYIPNYFTLGKDPTLNNPRTRRKLPVVLHPSIDLTHHLVCVAPDGSAIFVGGHWDNSVRAYCLPRIRLVAHASKHIDVVTCLAMDAKYVISGSRDTTCIIWDTSGLNSSSTSPAEQLKPIQVLYGHDKPVTCVALCTQLDMAVSGSTDGTVNVHTIKEGHYLRTLEPPKCSPERIITDVTLSYQGHVVCAVEEKGNYALHSYNVNGSHVGLSFNPFRFTCLATSGDDVISGDENGDVIIRRVLGLSPVESVPLQAAVQHLLVTPRSTHILAALRDGRIVVMAPSANIIQRV